MDMDLINQLIGIIPILILLAIIIGIFTLIRNKENIVKGTISVVISVAAFLVLISVLNPVASSEMDDSWYYDDYRHISGATDVSGSLESVNIGGVSYIHAKSLGSGSYSVKGKIIEIDVAKAPLSVVLVIGQSNSAYLGSSNPDTANPVPKIGTAYYFGSDEQPVFTSHENVNRGTYSFDGLGMYDMVSSEGTCKVGNIESPFAATFTGSKIYMINAGVGGTSSSVWVPGKSCWTYSSLCLESAINSIDTDVFDPTACAVVWIQGEADWFMPRSMYISNVTQLYDSLSDGTFNESFKFDRFLMSQTREMYNSSYAQEDLANTVSGIYLASTIATTFTIQNGCMNSDDLHYSQKGDNLLGVDLARFLNKLIARG